MIKQEEGKRKYFNYYFINMLPEHEKNMLFEKCLEITRVSNRILDLTESEQPRVRVLKDLEYKIGKLRAAIESIEKYFDLKTEMQIKD